MKGTMRWILVTALLIACVASASAYSVTSVSVSPTSEALVPGTSVTVSFTVEMAGSGDETFPMYDELDFTTDLDNPQWTADLLLNGNSNPQPLESKKSVYITGWILSYDPTDFEENLRMTLTGTVPAVSATADKTILKVEELDSRGNVVSGSTFTVTRKVVNTGEITTRIAQDESTLATFRTHIDEKAALDVDTATAEQKYSAAQTAISNAKAQPSTEYSAAITYLGNAESMLTDGETLLNKAWAEKSVADAQEPITKADAVISWLKPNATSGDAKSQLTEITTKREIAAGFISTANDEIFSGNYDRAREKADEAYTKGNETYNDALALKKTLSSGWFPSISLPGLPKGSSLFIIVGVVIVIVAAVGYVIYRKRTQWDELG
jgi:hypothetical protein